MTVTIGRQELLVALGGAAAVWPLVARAQQPAKVSTIGLLGAATLSTTSPRVAAFLQRLRDFGWVEDPQRATSGRRKFLATLGGASVAWPLRGARAVGRDTGDWIHEWLSRPPVVQWLKALFCDGHHVF
jgi:hypothetical protein